MRVRSNGESGVFPAHPQNHTDVDLGRTAPPPSTLAVVRTGPTMYITSFYDRATLYASMPDSQPKKRARKKSEFRAEGDAMRVRLPVRGLRRWVGRRLGGAGSAGGVRGNNSVRHRRRMVCCLSMAQDGCRVRKCATHSAPVRLRVLRGGAPCLATRIGGGIASIDLVYERIVLVAEDHAAATSMRRVSGVRHRRRELAWQECLMNSFSSWFAADPSSVAPSLWLCCMFRAPRHARATLLFGSAAQTIELSLPSSVGEIETGVRKANQKGEGGWLKGIPAARAVREP